MQTISVGMILCASLGCGSSGSEGDTKSQGPEATFACTGSSNCFAFWLEDDREGVSKAETLIGGGTCGADAVTTNARAGEIDATCGSEDGTLTINLHIEGVWSRTNAAGEGGVEAESAGSFVRVVASGNAAGRLPAEAALPGGLEFKGPDPGLFFPGARYLDNPPTTIANPELEWYSPRESESVVRLRGSLVAAVDGFPTAAPPTEAAP